MFAPAIAFVDLETTGTAPTGDRITEIGIVRVEDGAEWLVSVDEASSDSESAIPGEMAGPPLGESRADLRRWHFPRP